jgi:hypothetical protein
MLISINIISVRRGDPFLSQPEAPLCSNGDIFKSYLIAIFARYRYMRIINPKILTKLSARHLQPFWHPLT